MTAIPFRIDCHSLRVEPSLRFDPAVRFVSSMIPMDRNDIAVEFVMVVGFASLVGDEDDSAVWGSANVENSSDHDRNSPTSPVRRS